MDQSFLSSGKSVALDEKKIAHIDLTDFRGISQNVIVVAAILKLPNVHMFLCNVLGTREVVGDDTSSDVAISMPPRAIMLSHELQLQQKEFVPRTEHGQGFSQLLSIVSQKVEQLLGQSDATKKIQLL